MQNFIVPKYNDKTVHSNTAVYSTQLHVKRLNSFQRFIWGSVSDHFGNFWKPTIQRCSYLCGNCHCPSTPLVADVDKSKAILWCFMHWVSGIPSIMLLWRFVSVHICSRTEPCSRRHLISHHCLIFLTCLLPQTHSIRFKMGSFRNHSTFSGTCFFFA